MISHEVSSGATGLFHALFGMRHAPGEEPNLKLLDLFIRLRCHKDYVENDHWPT